MSQQQDDLLARLNEMNRRKFLGHDLYTSCVLDGRRVSQEDLQERLKDLQKEGKFPGCSVDNVAQMCMFSSSDKEAFKQSTCGTTDQSGYDYAQEVIDECPICMQSLDQFGYGIQKFSCGHKFHVKCIYDTLKHTPNGAFKCPMCNSGISGVKGPKRPANFQNKNIQLMYNGKLTDVDTIVNDLRDKLDGMLIRNHVRQPLPERVGVNEVMRGLDEAARILNRDNDRPRVGVNELRRGLDEAGRVLNRQLAPVNQRQQQIVREVRDQMDVRNPRRSMMLYVAVLMYLYLYATNDGVHDLTNGVFSVMWSILGMIANLNDSINPSGTVPIY